MERFSRLKRSLVLTSAVLLILFCALVLSSVARLQVHAHTDATPPPLGTAGNFAVLGENTVTNTGTTVVTGDLGVSPGTAVTGFPPGSVTGTIHAADAASLQAQKDVAVAYVNAAGQPCGVSLTGQDLGGKTLTSGVYCFTSSAQLTGQLTLDGQENPASVFIFQIGSSLTMASNASVLLTNGAQACNIFWQIGSSATVGTNTHFTGNILALTSISFTAGSVSNGGLYALNGVVTLDTNTITRSPCTSGITPTPTSTPTPTPTRVPTGTPTPTPTSTPTPTPTSTPTRVPTGTPTSTPTRVPTYPGMPRTGSDPAGSVAFCQSAPIESGSNFAPGQKGASPLHHP
jgi:Ice-binding-like